MLTMTTSMSLVSIAVTGRDDDRHTLGKGPVEDCSDVCNRERFSNDGVNSTKDFFSLWFESFEVLFVELIERFDLGLHLREEVVF